MEEELRKFCDTTGYLSNEKRNEYLASKGILHIVENEPIICSGMGGEYLKMRDLVEKTLYQMRNKKLGRMKIDTNEVLINKIDRNELEKIKRDIEINETITADEIDI